MKFLVLDANSIVNRAFYGVKLLTTKNGFYTNAVYGFMNILEKLKKEVNPDVIIAGFDLKTPTFRHKAYDGYKAGRKGMPPELAEQIPILKKLLKALGISVVECEGFEADDILGTVARICSERKYECTIATGDRDSLQLVDDNVQVRITTTKFGRPNVTLYDKQKIKDEFGIAPKQLIEVKALQGDTSDNIPGVKGIGPKGAVGLIQRYGNIDYIYDNLDNLDIKPLMKKKLTEGKESAFLSRMLGTIKCDIPLDKDFDKYVSCETYLDEAAKILRELEMFSVIERLSLYKNPLKKENDKTKKESLQLKTEKIENIEELNKIIKILSGKLFIFCEYDKKELTDIYLNNEDIIYCIHDKKVIDTFIKGISDLKAVKIIVYDAKSFYFSVNQDINIDFDILLAEYLLDADAKDYSIKKLCISYSIDSFDNEEYSDSIKSVSAMPLIYKEQLKKIKEYELEGLLKDVEIPFSKVLADMEKEGFRVDKEGIEAYNKEISVRIDDLTAKIYGFIGYEFNLNSPKQLSKALFEDLGLKPGKKTKSGYSTNAEVLEKLRYDHECVELILEYRTLSKLKSTYCEGLVKVIDTDGKIHTTFNQVETRTGRISSVEPNLQNIPVRTQVGRELRRFFIADKDCVLVDADYSQIELRVLADISQDKNMLCAFNSNEDIHKNTASQVFDLPEILITPLMRSRAKAVNFGIVYGIGAFSLSKDIGVSIKEAKAYIDGYLKHFSGIRNYMEDTVEKAKSQGYVKTLFNRRRYLPELSSSNYNIRAFGERIARNMPIQGTAADIIKIASVNVYKRLKKENMKSKLIMQVHDELIVNAPKDEEKKAAKILKEEMENAVKLSVKLTVDVKTGKSWYDTKD